MMNSYCISSCISDVHIPARPTYRNLYKWPESDAEFVRSVSEHGQSRYSGISCRQMYLRSYTFSTRKETMQERIKRKYFQKSKKGVTTGDDRVRRMRYEDGEDFGKLKEISCGASMRVFCRMLACGCGVSVH